MVVQTNPVTQEIKYRPVIDMSRHVNKYMIVPSCKLQDLTISEPWLEPDMFQTSIDLTSMFHPVKLNSSMFTYFSFALENEEGNLQYYQFKILQFGNAYAVYCVTKLLKTVSVYMHSQTILFSIFIDDIKILNRDKKLCELETIFCTKVLAWAGWNVNHKKSTLEPTQQMATILGKIASRTKIPW